MISYYDSTCHKQELKISHGMNKLFSPFTPIILRVCIDVLSLNTKNPFVFVRGVFLAFFDSLVIQCCT